MNYWLFQGNPEYFDFGLAIKDNVLDNWGVTHHRHDIHIGDKVIIWLTGKDRGVAGLAEVLDIPTSDFKPVDGYCWTEKGLEKNASTDKEKEKVYVKIRLLTDTKYFDKPITFFDKAKEIRLNVGQGYQNTNYSVTEEQFNIVKKLFNY